VDDARGNTPIRYALAALLAVQLLVGVSATVVLSQDEGKTVAPVKPPLLAVAPAPRGPSAPGETDAADAVGSVVQLFMKEGDPQPYRLLTNPTFEHVPLVLHVVAERGPWLQVQVNIRPNGTTAWIHRSEVTIRRVPNRVVVELGQRRLTVLHGNDVLAEHRVAIGAPTGPTPTGEFYIDATVHIPNPNGPYGVGQLSVSGFSDVYTSFGGGIGQIAMHGTNNPSAIGGTVSHGCIRLMNDAWTQVASMTSNGTPVSIRP